MEYCKVLETRKAPALPMSQEIHLREELCCHYPFQDRQWDATRNGKINTLYSTQQHVFKVTKTGMNALNSLLLHFKMKISGIILDVSETISLLAAFQNTCAFTTLLQRRSQANGFIWVFGMGEPGLEKNCHLKWVKTRYRLCTFWKTSPIRFPFLCTSQRKEKKEKRIMVSVIEDIDLPKEVEEKTTAFSSTVLNRLLGLVFKSHINFAVGKAVRHIGLLRNSNEETTGMDGNRAEESWRPGNSKFSHFFSLSVLLSGLVCSQGHPPQSALGWDSLITSFGSPCPENQESVKWKGKLNLKSPLSHMASGRGVQISKTSPQLILKPENP